MMNATRNVDPDPRYVKRPPAKWQSGGATFSSVFHFVSDYLRAIIDPFAQDSKHGGPARRKVECLPSTSSKSAGRRHVFRSKRNMGNDPDLTTTTLHSFVGAPNDPEAWSAFVDRYGKQIHAWCRRWGLQEADAEDVTQEVLAKLARILSSYDRSKGRFRAWLKTVTRNALNDYLEGQRRAVTGSGDSGVRDKIESAQAREDLVEALHEAFDLELFECARARVQLRVSPQTWEAFQLLEFDGLSGAEVAARTGMKVATVYVTRGRVREMLQEEVQKLDQPDFQEK